MRLTGFPGHQHDQGGSVTNRQPWRDRRPGGVGCPGDASAPDDVVGGLLGYRRVVAGGGAPPSSVRRPASRPFGRQAAGKESPRAARGWIHKAGNDGLIKLVADIDRDVLVGATSVGPAGGEVLGALVVVVHARVPVGVLAGMIYPYPTFHRALEDAVKWLR